MFVIMTVCVALAVPASWPPKSNVAGEIATCVETRPVPRPDKPTGWVPGEALLDMLMAPGILAFVVGWKATLIAQLCPAPSGVEEAGQLLLWE